jgi:hypothetical protein
MHQMGSVFRVRLGSALMLAVATMVLDGRLLAQSSLAELARKEAERRKAVSTPSKVYTDKDLPATAQKPAIPPATDGDPAPDPVAAALADQRATQEKAQAQAEQKSEAWWKGRMLRAREELRRNEIFAESLQSRVNALTREYALPIAGARRYAVGEQRTEALNELSRVKQDIDVSKKQIADIEEEARRAGVPPGWLR